jgi:flagellar motor switch protein FliN/FliY
MTQAEAMAEDVPEDDLNKAIEELRGVLHEDAAGTHNLPPAFSQESSAPNNAIIMDIPVEVQIVLGAAQMPVAELMALQKGSTVALDRRIGEPVDVMVNGRKLARGEITVLESDPSRFGIRLTEIVTVTKSA